MAEGSDEKAVRALAAISGLEYFPPRLIDTRRGDLANLLPESVAREYNDFLQPSTEAGVKLLMIDPLDFESIIRVEM
jgi:hypothetical protein